MRNCDKQAIEFDGASRRDLKDSSCFLPSFEVEK
jgi:hypothetical protein